MIAEELTPPVSERLRKPGEPLEYMRHGADPTGAYPDNLALSGEWRMYAGEMEIPVCSVPVTHGGPHSFCQILLEQGTAALNIKVCSLREVFRARIHTLNGDFPFQLQGNEIRGTVTGPGYLTVEINDRIYAPLTIIIRSPVDCEKYGIGKRCGDGESAAKEQRIRIYKAGIHEVESVELKDNETLYLEPGAVLRAVQPAEDEMPETEKDWAGIPNYADFIRADNRSNIKIIGYGIIDLSGLSWHARRTIRLTGCENVVLDGPVLIGAAHWTTALFRCENVKVRNLVMLGYRQNSDGIDLVNCRNVHVDGCYIRTGDDAICIKSMEAPPVCGGEKILVENCTVWDDKVRGIGIAGESKSDICDVIFRDCLVLHGLADWAYEMGALCITLCDSGTVSDILFENIRILQESACAINCMLYRDRWSTDTQAGHIRDIRFRNIRIPENTPIRIWGYDEGHEVENIYLEQIDNGGEPLWIDQNPYVKNVIVSGNEASGKEV